MNDTVNQPSFFQPNVYGPITPSQMFERTSALLRENFKMFFGIVLVVIGVEIVVGGVLGGAGLWIERVTAGTAPLAKALFIVPLSLLGAALIFILTQIIQGALFIATQAKLASAPMSVGEACRLAADKAGRLIGISLLVALRVFGYLLLFWLAAALLLLAVGLAFGGFSRLAGGIPFHAGHSQFLGLGIFFVLLMLTLLVLYLLVLLWLVVRYAIAIPASLAENISITESIRRSIHLSHGSRGRLYALFLVVFGVSIAFAAVTLPVQLMAAHSANLHPGAKPLLFGIITMALAIFRILVSAVLIAITGVATALCYYDLRVRKEGFGAPSAAALQEISPAIVPPPPDLPMEDFPIS